jgi:hypothetical protein
LFLASARDVWSASDLRGVDFNPVCQTFAETEFGIAVDTARIQDCWPDVIDPVVVGIGYPTDSVSTALDLRMIDLTTPISEERLKKGFIAKMPRPSEGFGGMDNYFRVIEEEVKPRVETMVAINRQEQVLMGHSLGGLTTLVGTSPNIIVSRVREEMVGEPFRMFDYLPTGLGLAGVAAKTNADGTLNGTFTLPQDGAGWGLGQTEYLSPPVPSTLRQPGGLPAARREAGRLSSACRRRGRAPRRAPCSSRRSSTGRSRPSRSHG